VESPSGRGRTPRKRVRGQPLRGFKSHLHREGSRASDLVTYWPVVAVHARRARDGKESRRDRRPGHLERGQRTVSLQCLNQAGGPADDRYVAADVPRFVAARVRVEPPGKAWGIAGYSEGGYCTANLALRRLRRYGFTGVMSGYFQPASNRLEYGHVLRHVDPFHGSITLRRQNSRNSFCSIFPPESGYRGSGWVRPARRWRRSRRPRAAWDVSPRARRHCPRPDPGRSPDPGRRPSLRAPRSASLAPWRIKVEHPGVQHGTLVERRPQRPVQAVLQVQVAFPLDDVREKVTVER
jgi:Putative esterase